jgi:hypothetical protein
MVPYYEITNAHIDSSAARRLLKAPPRGNTQASSVVAMSESSTMPLPLNYFTKASDEYPDTSSKAGKRKSRFQSKAICIPASLRWRHCLNLSIDRSGVEAVFVGDGLCQLKPLVFLF